MADDHRHHEVAAHHVHQAEKPAIGHLVHDELDALKGVLVRGNIVEEQQNAGEDLEDEGGKGNHAQGIKDIDILRNPVFGKLGAD